MPHSIHRLFLFKSRRLVRSAAIAIVCLASIFGSAQTVTTPGGNTGSVPVFTGSTSIGNSSISDSGGVVSVGEPVGIAAFSQGAPVGLTILNTSGVPEFESTSSILFKGAGDGSTPVPFAMIESGGQPPYEYYPGNYDYGDGFLGFWTAAGGILTEQMTLSDAGNLGIGTTSPMGEISIVTSAHEAETGIHVDNRDTSGYSVLRLFTGTDQNGYDLDGSLASGLGLHQFGSSYPGDPNTTRSPSSTDLEAYEANGLTLDTYQNAPIRFFTGGVYQANERMRILGTGNIGIGTPSPLYTLDVNGIVNATSYYLNGAPLGTINTSSPSFTGNVGIGTTSPSSPLTISGPDSKIELVNTNTNTHSYFYDAANGFQLAYNRLPETGSIPNPSLSSAFVNVNGDTSGGAYMDVVLQNAPGATTGFTDVLHMTGSGGGAIGIGTSTPGSEFIGTGLGNKPVTGSPLLEVNGSIALTYQTGGQIYFPDDTVQATAWNGTTLGGDYAESVDVTGVKEAFEPGDILVIDPDHPGQFMKSTTPYSPLVAGVYSTKPGLTGRRTPIDGQLSGQLIPMAMIGIVPTKVSAENGPIHTGDLIVSGSLDGRGMRAGDRKELTGLIVGKSLGNLEAGVGVIEVLVTLQ